MPSPSLIFLHSRIDAIPDGTPLTAARKVLLKEALDDIYVMVIKEEALHIRKHLRAAMADATNPRRILWEEVIQRVIDEDGRLTIETAEAF